MKITTNYDKAITKLEKTWKRIGKLVTQCIREDAIDGVFQNGRSDTYRSEQYKKYKRNDMRRYTTGEGQTFSDKSGYFFGTTFFRNEKANLRKGQQITTGKRLKAYQGVSITSRETSFVNMILTGQLFRGLKVKSYDETGVTIGYDSKDAMKIVGNRAYGREVVGLNDDNIKKVKEELIKGIDENLRKEMKDIKINVVI
jgi:hypothetical protein